MRETTWTAEEYSLFVQHSQQTHKHHYLHAAKLQTSCWLNEISLFTPVCTAAVRWRPLVEEVRWSTETCGREAGGDWSRHTSIRLSQVTSRRWWSCWSVSDWHSTSSAAYMRLWWQKRRSADCQNYLQNIFWLGKFTWTFLKLEQQHLGKSAEMTSYNKTMADEG